MTRDTSNLGHVWAERMTKSERDQSFPDSEPRDAATLMLIDRSGAKPKVLLGRRHASHKFMPGKFVFPGGRIEALDRDDAGGERIASRHAEETASSGWPIRARILPARFALAAVRETAEETGLLLGVKRDDAAGGAGRHLDRIRQGERASRPRRDPFHRPRHHAAAAGRERFDTRFFTADASPSPHTIEGVVGPDSELVELAWVPIEEATQLDMPTITGVVLEELLARVEAGMAHALPVPFYFMMSSSFSGSYCKCCKRFLDFCRFGARFPAKNPPALFRG